MDSWRNGKIQFSTHLFDRFCRFICLTACRQSERVSVGSISPYAGWGDGWTMFSCNKAKQIDTTTCLPVRLDVIYQFSTIGFLEVELESGFHCGWEQTDRRTEICFLNMSHIYWIGFPFVPEGQSIFGIGTIFDSMGTGIEKQ